MDVALLRINRVIRWCLVLVAWLECFTMFLGFTLTFGIRVGFGSEFVTVVILCVYIKVYDNFCSTQGDKVLSSSHFVEFNFLTISFLEDTLIVRGFELGIIYLLSQVLRANGLWHWNCSVKIDSLIFCSKLTVVSNLERFWNSQFLKFQTSSCLKVAVFLFLMCRLSRDKQDWSSCRHVIAINADYSGEYGWYVGLLKNSLLWKFPHLD